MRPERLTVMQIFRWNLAFLLVFVALVPLSAQSQDGAAASEPGAATAYLRRHHEEINRALRRRAAGEAAREARRNEVTEVIRSLLDLDAMGRAALGNHWNDHTDEERQEFLGILRQLVENNYRQNLEGTKNYAVDYEDETRTEHTILVSTTARDSRNRRAPAVEINYTVRSHADRFVVVDITTDGVSMVRNYRSQFSRIIRRDGWDTLIERMRARLSEQQD